MTYCQYPCNIKGNKESSFMEIWIDTEIKSTGNFIKSGGKIKILK
jgi:hypothetical protein